MEKTVKIRAYSGEAPQARHADEKAGPDEQRAKLATQLEDERNKSLELLKEIVQLRESLKQEQARAADLEAKLIRLASVEDSQLARKNELLEEEKKKSLEQLKTIEQLRESIKQDQARNAEVAGKAAELEAKTRAVAELESRVKDLSGVLSAITKLAAAGKPDITA